MPADPRTQAPSARVPGEARVAVVTPSFNQAPFLRDCIESVLRQDGPSIDYLVVDGGSTDGSVDILRSYGDRIRWSSEPDRGQADAIAKGFARTGGEILTWLNADDVLRDGAVARAVAAFDADPALGLVYGDGDLIDEEGRHLRPFHEIEPFSLWRLIHGLDYVLQPAAFFRRGAFAAAGGLDPSLHWALDWDLWIRIAAVAEVKRLDGGPLAASRIWSSTKTSTGGGERIRELARVAKRHAGRSWTPGVRLYALDALRGFAAGRRPLVALADALSHAVVLRMAAFADGWLGRRGEVLFPRRWGAAELELELPAGGSRRGRVVARLDGREIGRFTVARPGVLRLRAIAAPGKEPFCRLQVCCDWSVQGRPDRRRLACRLQSLAPLR